MKLRGFHAATFYPKISHLSGIGSLEPWSANRNLPKEDFENFIQIPKLAGKELKFPIKFSKEFGINS